MKLEAPEQSSGEAPGQTGTPGKVRRTWEQRMLHGSTRAGKNLRKLGRRLSFDGLSAWMGNLIRRREAWLVLLAIGIGAIAGLVVLVLRELAYWMQAALYQLSAGERLSAVGSIAFDFAFVPALGGLLLGLLGLLLR